MAQHHQQPSGGGSSISSSGSDDDEDEEARRDPYYRYRRQALQLTRRWQRAARAATAAYSAGRHGDARHAAAAAQRWRREALAAHAAAAEQIEAANNGGPNSSLFELDLHGLYVHEATAALDRRLELLQCLLADGAAVGPGGGAAPARALLHVVVGRGMHSSGGEASLPRAVESHLKAAGLRYEPRLGAVDVVLRRPAAAAAAAMAQGAAAERGVS